MRLLLFFLLFIAINCDAQQKIKRHDLLGKWYTDNKDSLFFKSDTILLVKYTNRANWEYLKEKERPFIEPDPCEHIEIGFLRDKRLKFIEKYYHVGYSRALNSTYWKIKANKLSLIFVNDTVSYEKYEIIELKQFSFTRQETNYPTDTYKTYYTPSMLLRRIPSTK